MQGKDPYPAKQREGAYSLGWDYGTGSGPRSGEYHDGDKMTELITPSVSMEQLRADILAEWRDKGTQEGTVSYSISKNGKIGALKKLLQLGLLPALRTGGVDHGGRRSARRQLRRIPPGQGALERNRQNSSSHCSRSRSGQGPYLPIGWYGSMNFH